MGRALSTAAAIAVFAAGAEAARTPAPSSSRFACYPAQFSLFRARTVTILDRLGGTRRVVLSSPEMVCAPGVVSSSAFLTCYRVKGDSSRVSTKIVTVIDEFALAVLKPRVALRIDRLAATCLPSVRSDVRGTSADKAVGTVTCYSARPQRLASRNVIVTDAFGTSADAVSTPPARVCVPAAVKAVPRGTAMYLTCYIARSQTIGSTIVLRDTFGYLKAALGQRNTVCTRASVS